MTTRELDRIREDIAENLRDSVWWVDGQRIEAADRFIWLDMKALLDERDALAALVPAHLRRAAGID